MALPTTAELNYLKQHPKWNLEKPYTFFADASKIRGASLTNIENETVSNQAVTDIRATMGHLAMDEHGFEVIQLGQKLEDSRFDDEEWVQGIYYPEICQLVKNKLNAKAVKPYQHKVSTFTNLLYFTCSNWMKARYRHPGFGDPRLRGPDGYDPPIPMVHAGEIISQF